MLKQCCHHNPKSWLVLLGLTAIFTLFLFNKVISTHCAAAVSQVRTQTGEKEKLNTAELRNRTEQNKKHKTVSDECVSQTFLTRNDTVIFGEIHGANYTNVFLYNKTVRNRIKPYLSRIRNITEHLMHHITRLEQLRYVENILNVNFVCEPQNICEKKLIFLAYVLSHPKHESQRMFIRHYWGNYTRFLPAKYRLMFVLGKIDDANVTSSVLKEHKTYGDILQADFIDSYRNLSTKSMIAIKWIGLHCQNTALVLKVDDDIFVHTPNLLNFMQNATTRNVKWAIIGHIARHARPIRYTSSKFYVSNYDYDRNTYPVFCVGAAYILPMDVIMEMPNAMHSVPYLPFEDVYITGLLAEKMKVNHFNFEPGRFVLESKKSIRILKNGTSKLLFGHKLGNPDASYIWNYVILNNKNKNKI